MIQTISTLNIQIPSMSYSKSTGNIILRYFTVSQAIEYTIPKLELRIRDPKTGQRLPLMTQSSNQHSDDGKEDVIPVHFDFKGHYGVAINWSDGYFADIYPFDVLKSIAEEISLANKRKE